MCDWIGIKKEVVGNPWEHLAQHRIKGGGKKNRRIKFLIWVAVVWIIWINRNRIIFRGGVPNVIQMLNYVKGLIWGWIANKLGNQVSIDFEEYWNNSLLSCINRLQ